MGNRRWNIKPIDAEKTTQLQHSLRINDKLCRILVQRGYDTFEAARNFFRPELSQLHSPWLMKDMHKAVNRLEQAFINREKILVFGDYDVDGTTSVAMMYSFLRDIYITEQLDYYIPHRYREGYGVSKAGIEYAHQNGFSLIISLDCGIKSVELVCYAKNLGIDFIICDHHLPDIVLPDAIAILNPKQDDCEYPFKELCGCGVGFKLISAIAEKNNIPKNETYKYLDLVATAIAADIVPIVDENRILAYYGLQIINSNPSTGIKALMKLSSVSPPLTINNVVFVIAPRVNAAGRMDDARKAVQLFIEKNEEEAVKFAEMLHTDNIERKDADRSITEEALQMIHSDPLLKEKKSTVVFQNHWHKGVVGIVASRLIETFYRPTIVLTEAGEFATGSARSVPGFNLYEAIYACREHLTTYGGHFAAAGLTLKKENLEAFIEMFEHTVSQSISDDLLTPEIIIDTEATLGDITESFYNIIHQMEPFGPANMRPVFLIKNVSSNGYAKILKEQHLRFVATDGKHYMSCIGFNMADKFDLLSSPVNIVCTIDENVWNDVKSLQLKVIDLAPAN